MKPLDLISAAPWRRVCFTTYALSLSFFEAVMLDAMLRGKARDALILADPEGIRAGLSEQGARRVGREYEIDPVACTNHGVFHPKISVLLDDDDAHLLIGSGNLTFAGWGGNFERIDHLHPSFAATAFRDAAEFFERLPTSPHIVTTAGDACTELASDLRKAAARGGDTKTIRLLHSLDRGIGPQLKDYADDLGGVVRVTTVSPFYDLRGEGLRRLAQLLNCDRIELHAHTGELVRGQAAAWPFDAKPRWPAVNISEVFADDRRPLHAKAFELECARGRLLVSGSANATDAGLFGRNVEACVLRVQPKTKSFWVSTKSVAPARVEQLDSEVDLAASRAGVLGATLEADGVAAQILTPRFQGIARATLETPAGARDLGEVQIGADGRFRVAAPGADLESWRHGRLVLRVSTGSDCWEGFVSIAAALELIRRTGGMARHLMTMLSGDETPADVAAIMAWFYSDPTRIPKNTGNWGRCGDKADKGGASDPVTASEFDAARTGNIGGPVAGGDASVGWRHTMSLIRSAFSRVRGPWPESDAADGEEEDDNDGGKTREKTDADREKQKLKALKHFDLLLPLMLDPEGRGYDPHMALALTHFMTDRFRPERGKVQLWLDKCVPHLSGFTAPEADFAVSAVLLHHIVDARDGNAARARQFFRRRGVPLTDLPVNPELVSAFVDTLAPDTDLDAFLEECQGACTRGEEVEAYIAAARARRPATGYENLMLTPYWDALERALHDAAMFDKIIILPEARSACPLCSRTFPAAAAEDLRVLGVARCCGRLFLNEGC